MQDAQNLTLKVQCKIVAECILIFFSEKIRLVFHVNCLLADNSQEIASLIFSEKIEIFQNVVCFSSEQPVNPV